MSAVCLIHHSDEAHLLYIARVSSDQRNTDPALIGYLMRNGHWSPFEMIGACVEIVTTRDIARQILRHRSFSFQEFSQRYAEVMSSDLAREMRLKGSSNRQGSSAERDDEAEYIAAQAALAGFDAYDRLIAYGVAPECARAVLPEGFAPTRLYMNGTLRSWLHYLRERLHVDPVRGVKVAQAEHVLLAEAIFDLLAPVFPATFAAVADAGYIDHATLPPSSDAPASASQAQRSEAALRQDGGAG